MDDPVSSSSTAATQDEPIGCGTVVIAGLFTALPGAIPTLLLLTAFASGQMGPAGLYVIVDTALILLGLALFGVMITSGRVLKWGLIYIAAVAVGELALWLINS